ncbi:hypothetical protein C0995_002272, partial [Termitomyces sp. Mi166
MNPRWAREMVRRSKMEPLTVTYWGALLFRDRKAPRQALEEILRDHVVRIKSLTIGSARVPNGIHRRHDVELEYWNQQDREELRDAFFYLQYSSKDPVNAPLMERLEICFPGEKEA